MTKARAIFLIREYVTEHLKRPEQIGRMEDFEARVYQRQAAYDLAKHIRDDTEWDPVSSAFIFATKMEDYYMTAPTKKQFDIFYNAWMVADDIHEILFDIDYPVVEGERNELQGVY